MLGYVIWVSLNTLLFTATNTPDEDTGGVVSLISTEKVMDSDEVSPPSLWTEYNFCK